MSDGAIGKLKAQVERLTQANARLATGGAPASGFLATYYQKHIRTGSFRPVLHMMGVLVATGIAVCG